MSATDVIAIWGAVSGTVAAVVAIANYLRDRSNLRVKAETVFASDMGAGAEDAHPWLRTVTVEISNLGRQPVTIISVRVVSSRDDRRDNGGGWITPTDDDRFTPFFKFPTVIRGGEVLIATGLNDHMARFAEVTDMRGHEIVVPIAGVDLPLPGKVIFPEEPG